MVKAGTTTGCSIFAEPALFFGEADDAESFLEEGRGGFVGGHGGEGKATMATRAKKADEAKREWGER
jgi:hypothetical protein